MTDETTAKPRKGILLKARNGDVIGFDETGLRMNLSDSVISDIGRRLGSAGARVDASVLGDIDAWNVREANGWYVFSARLPGEQGVREFRRLKEAVDDGTPDIFANPTGALFAVLGLGGPRRADTYDVAPRFPFHVVTAGDDLGAAGNSGSEENTAVTHVQTVREQTRDSLIADEIIAQRHADFRALPVIFSRTEADSAASIAKLTTSIGYRNFEQTLANFCAGARVMDLPAKVLSVNLDYVLEDVVSSGDEWRAGMYALMDKVTDLFADHGLRKPLFTTMFDAGTQGVTDTPVLRAQWELSWNHGSHDFVHVAPSYMFGLNEFGRPDQDALIQMTEMEAAAIEAMNADTPWACPLFLLAEREDNGKTIRCRAQAQGTLVLDENDPLSAGKECGFHLMGATNKVKIKEVSIAKDDPCDILIRFDKAPKGDALELAYAIGHAPSSDGMPANRGAVRDTWSMGSRTGQTLYRWALPAVLPVH